jgi:ribonuclease HI
MIKERNMKMDIIAYTDGACSGNPGIGGYGAILTYKGQEREVRGFTTNSTTNNAMELRAVVEVINWLNKVQKKPCNIEIRTDSQYIVNCTSHKTKKWFEGRKNEDLWMELITAGNKGKHKITFVKIKGHSGDIMNERCDKIAKAECAKAKHALCKR